MLNRLSPGGVAFCLAGLCVQSPWAAGAAAGGRHEPQYEPRFACGRAVGRTLTQDRRFRWKRRVQEESGLGLLLSAGHAPSPSPHGGLGGGARWGWDAPQLACHSHTDRHPRVSSSEWRLAPEQGSVLFQALTPVSVCPSFISNLELSQLSDSQFSKPSVPERCSPSACLLPSPERSFGFAVTVHGGSEKGRWPAGAELAVDPSRLSPWPCVFTHSM